MQTIDKPIDSEEFEKKGLKKDRQNSVRQCKITKWYLTR